MTEIRPLAPADRDDWLPLWRGYLEFYERELSDEQTALTFGRLVDPEFPIHGAIAREMRGQRDRLRALAHAPGHVVARPVLLPRGPLRRSGRPRDRAQVGP